MTSKTLPLRLDDEVIERVDRLAQLMAERSGGVAISRTAAMRAAMLRGMESLEQELGTAGRPKQPKRK